MKKLCSCVGTFFVKFPINARVGKLDLKFEIYKTMTLKSSPLT